MNSKLLLLLLVVQLNAILAFETEYFQKFGSVLEASTFCKHFTNLLPANISKTCAVQLNESCQHTEVIETLLDATSKFPYTGLKTAKRLDIGNFDECLAVDHKYNGGRILGKHCFAGLILPSLSNPKDPYRLSTCIPSGCSADDFNAIFQTIFNNYFPGKFLDKYCNTKEDKKPWAPEDYVTTVLILICAWLMTVSTIYDFYLKRAKKKTTHKLYLAFSVYTNGRRLLQTSKSVPNSEQILIFHGLKVISMMWIIAGHGATTLPTTTMFNLDYYYDFKNNSFASLYISSSVYAVDTFFWISGFLMAYQFLKSKNKPLKSQIISIPINILHRYLRLTPAALMMFLFAISLYARIGTGPAYDVLTDYVQKNCRKHWWAFFLYIQNYHNYKDEDMCLIPTWYLSADMQLFLIAPLVLIPLAVALRDNKKFRICMWCLVALNVVAVIIPIVINLQFRDYANTYATHLRLVVYFIGIMMGAFMRQMKDRPFINAKYGVRKLSIINLIMWTIVLSVLLTLILWNKYVELHGEYEYVAVFTPLAKAVWAICLCWIVYSSHYGYGGFINWMLTRPIMQVLGRLTYSIYLVHALVVFHYFMVERAMIYSSNYILFYMWCGHTFISILVALFWTLAFESPLMIVEKLIFGGIQRQKRPQPKNENVPKTITVEVIHKDLNGDKATANNTKDI